MKNQSENINFDNVDMEIAKIDLYHYEEKFDWQQMSQNDRALFKENFHTDEKRLIEVEKTIFKQLRNSKSLQKIIDYDDLNTYVYKVFESMSKQHKKYMQISPLAYFKQIKNHIESMITLYAKKEFYRGIERDKIICQDSYSIKKMIELPRCEENIGRSLYEGEGEMNKTEWQFIQNLTSLDNIKWWHRNLSRSDGFCINAFINHYPDFMIMTMSGKIILAETKGDFLNNDDTAQKIKLGRKWAEKAGEIYRYYMVFENASEEDLSNGVTNMNDFMDIMRGL